MAGDGTAASGMACTDGPVTGDGNDRPQTVVIQVATTWRSVALSTRFQSMNWPSCNPRPADPIVNVGVTVGAGTMPVQR